MRPLLLASSSPRRAELLRQIGVPFTALSRWLSAHASASMLMPAGAGEVDESVRVGESAEDYVRRLAAAKALAGWQCVASTLAAQEHTSSSPDQKDMATAAVLGADTTVVLDDTILGKPCDAEDAKRMLRSLSGREHRVLSAVNIYCQGRAVAAMSETHVRFATLTDATIARYLATAESFDKAGAYGIQGFGAVLVESIKGSYSGVVGLPLTQTSALLSAVGISSWQVAESAQYLDEEKR